MFDVALHARDYFYLTDSESDLFFEAWVAAIRGKSQSVSLRMMGRERATYLCRFSPEFDAQGVLESIAVSMIEDAGPGGQSVPSASFVASALKSISSPIVIVDRFGKLLWVNHAFCSLLEFDEKDLLGESLVDKLGPQASEEDRKLFVANLENCCEFQQVVRDVRLAANDCSVRLEASPIEGGPSASYIVKVGMVRSRARDVSASISRIEEVRQLFRQVTGANDELEAALDSARAQIEMVRGESQAKTDFLANMSHEIRTPMNAVIGFCDLLLNTRLDEEQSEFVEAIYQSGQLLIQLIGQVLDFSKIESGHLELVEEEISLEQIMLEVQAIMGTRLRSKSLEFRLDCDGVADQAVIGDATRIKQILVNLLGNAYKFTREGFIGLHAQAFESRHENHLCLRVKVEDSGIGVDPARLSSLFNPFSQASSRIARDYGGTGLGLAICKRLCQAMLGDIWVESTSKAGGSVFGFEIHLPLSENARGSEKPASQSRDRSAVLPDTQTDAKTLRVLVVDDNPNNLIITSKLSEHLGCKATTVRSGVRAVDLLKEEDFDVVLMDVRMAPISGMETTRLIRDGHAGEGRADVYIIALTAQALQGDRELCLGSGMNDYLSKPLTLEKLSEALLRARESISLD